MKAKIQNKVTLLNGSATKPTVELYQLESGRCRVWWYCFDQEGVSQGTIRTFLETDWTKALEKGKATLARFLTKS
jgi:hypothetical protein